MTDVRPPLVHIHISKTAGTAIRELFQSHYEPAAVFKVEALAIPRAIRRYLQLGAEDRRRIAYVTGFMPFGFHAAVGDQPRYFTMLRHPVDRVISHYHYVKRNTRALLHEPLMREGATLQDYVTTFSGSSFVNNGHVRYLGARKMHPVEHPSEHALERAEERLLETYVTFGLVERFDDSLRMLAEAAPWIPSTFERVNANPEEAPAEAVDPATRDLIAETNSLDMDLYEKARSEFEARAESLRSSAR